MLLLERLRPEERAAFVLHEAFDCDYAEIAKTVHNEVDAIKALLEELLISTKFEGIRHHACRIREHAVPGDYGISLDTTWSL